MDLAKLMEVGKELDFSGSDLMDFIKEQQDRARDERAEQLELKKTEQETARLNLRIVESQQNVGAAIDVGRQKARTPKLPPFHEDKDDLDAYLQRYERYASSQGWPEVDWAINLSALLTGKALEVYSRLPADEANQYCVLKSALLKRFQLTAECFRSKFFSCKPQNGETGHQYATRLENYLDRWIELSDIKQSYDVLRDLLLRSQFVDGCHRDLTLFVKERQPETLKDTTEIAQQYLEARGGTFKPPPSTSNTNSVVPPADGNTSGFTGKPSDSCPPEKSRQNQRQCFLCHKPGHLAKDCSNSFSSRPVQTCYVCHKPGHLARNCNFNTNKAAGLYVHQQYPTTTAFNEEHHNTHPQMQYNSVPNVPNMIRDRNYPPEGLLSNEPQRDHDAFTVPSMNQWNHPTGSFSNEPRNDHYVPTAGTRAQASCMVVNLPASTPHECCLNESRDRVNLQCGHSLPVLSAVCCDNLVQSMPVVSGMVGDRKVNVLRDSGCSCAVVRKDLVHETQLTGEENSCVLIDGTIRKLPVARVNVNTPYYVGNILALCMETPLCDLILGNLDGIRAPSDPDRTWTLPPHTTGAEKTTYRTWPHFFDNWTRHEMDYGHVDFSS